MADFSAEELKEILDSEDFQHYLEISGEEETNLALTHYLQNARNHAFWEEKFAGRQTPAQDEPNAEHELEVYLESVYTDEKGTEQDITPETWNSKEYLEWRDKYAQNHPDDTHYALLLSKVELYPAHIDTPQEDNHAQAVRQEQVNVAEQRDGTPAMTINAQQELYRERSSHSDSNEFLLDKAKLSVLLQMNKISQEIYAAGVKDPAAAIEKLNDKLPLNAKEEAEFEDLLSDLMINNEQIFELVPPAFLAKQYLKLNAEVRDKSADQNKLAAKQAMIEKLAQRMDKLSLNLYSNADLFFSDVTNISDTYDGYMQMFKARETYLEDNAQGAQIKAINQANRATLENIIQDYDHDHNLQDVANIGAAKLDSRFDKLNQSLAKVYPDEEILALVGNFRFLDNSGNPEPQFVDKDGHEQVAYSAGSKIKQGGKLDTMLRIARQNVLLRQLGSNENITPENLKAAINEELPTVLYAAHVANQVEQGAKENINQFTNRAYLNQFVTDLANVEKPMAVSATAYEAAVDNCINSVGAYAHRLGGKIGRDQAVVLKVFEPLQDIDKRSADRVTYSRDKRKVRLEQLKRLAKNGLAAFGMSGAITLAGAAVATDSALTAATLGMNKYAGMLVGSAMAIGYTCKQIRRWNKEQKALGKKHGLLAMLKDRRMMMTVGTTALGAFALGCAVTGNPGAAQALGGAAMVLGAANGAINAYQDVAKSGLGKGEAALWAAAQAAVTLGAGFAGRHAANQFIDSYNAHNPDNEIFQHKDIVGQHTETTIEQTYAPETVENAQKILDYWYNDNPDLLQQRIEAIEAYNTANGTDINPQRYLLAAHDSGALSADNNLLHVQGGDNVNTSGNHKVFGIGWSQETGVSQNMVGALAGSVGADGINITPESIAAFRAIDPYISPINQVGYVPGTPFQNDGVLGYNAETRADGRAHHSANGDTYRTYADGDSPFAQNVTEKVVDEYGMARNDSGTMVGTVGVLGNRILSLKERIGSLADRLFGKKTTAEKKDNGLKQADKHGETEQQPGTPAAVIKKSQANSR